MLPVFLIIGVFEKLPRWIGFEFRFLLSY